MIIVPVGARRARLRSVPAIVVGAAMLLLSVSRGMHAQAGDSTRVRGDSAQRLESVLVHAIRGSDAAPIAQKTIGQEEIRRANFGQDAPLLLQRASPSLTAHTETGTSWGYSYLRLRGLDQTRVNITLDGVPLNDMEDQVLYFANFADLMSDVRSVQVQRGVGTSSAGTASFGGSINFETQAIARATPSGDVQAQVGSLGAQRASIAYGTGLTSSRFAAFARASAVRTNGYREHSGVMGNSAFVGAGYFGDRNILKLTALVGLLADTLSYVGATREELAINRKFNPLAPDELDRFGQQMVALSLTHASSEHTSLNATVYRNSASGHYDYFSGADRYRYGLAHEWYGFTAAANHDRGIVHLNAGINANTYSRSHESWLRPDLDHALYDNSGDKKDVSAFTKVSIAAGRILWFGDLQARHATFTYNPDANAGIDKRSVDWTFVNPKAGVTFQLANALVAFASFGVTSREPARSDLLAGEDDLNASNVDALGDFRRVKPESVRDAEAGIRLHRSAFDLEANVYNMSFRNDIAPIGTPTASGSIPRRNVGSSFRRGVEADASWRPHTRMLITANATVSDNRIRQYADSSGDAPKLLRNVEPMLTPRFLTSHAVQVQALAPLSLMLAGHYQSRAFLDNTSNAARILPDYYQLDASARYSFGQRYSLVVRGVNLGDTRKFGSGSASYGEVRYFVLPARSVYVTGEVNF